MSSEPLIIVDGYNLMHQIVAPRIVGGPGGLERSRAIVINRVRQLVPKASHPETTIVFDANSGDLPTGSTDGNSTMGQIRIEFATEYPDADSMIEELIRRHSSPARLTVVSSDRRLIDASRKRGANGVDCQTWMDHQEDLARRERAKQPASNQPGSADDKPVDSVESRYWMREFGFEPPPEQTPEQ